MNSGLCEVLNKHQTLYKDIFFSHVTAIIPHVKLLENNVNLYNPYELSDSLYAEVILMVRLLNAPS